MPKKTKVKANKNKLKKETMLDKIKKFFNKFKIAKPKTTSQIIRIIIIQFALNIKIFHLLKRTMKHKKIFF